MTKREFEQQLRNALHEDFLNTPAPDKNEFFKRIEEGIRAVSNAGANQYVKAGVAKFET